MIQRLRIEPYSDYLERYRKAKSFPVSVANGLVFVSGLPTLSGGSRLVAAPCAQVQCLLHARAVELRDIQHGL